MIISPEELSKALNKAGIETEPDKTIRNQVASVSMEGFSFSSDELNVINELIKKNKNDYNAMIKEVIAQHECKTLL